MLALIKLTLTLPGLSPPKMSWVTLPIAPTGVVSVSPVTRQATRQPEGQCDRDSSFPNRHAEAGVPEPGKRNKRHELAAAKPAHRRLDVPGLARSRRAEGEHLSEITERAQCRAPAQRKAQ